MPTVKVGTEKDTCPAQRFSKKGREGEYRELTGVNVGNNKGRRRIVSGIRACQGKFNSTNYIGMIYDHSEASSKSGGGAGESNRRGLEGHVGTVGDGSDCEFGEGMVRNADGERCARNSNNKLLRVVEKSERS